MCVIVHEWCERRCVYYTRRMLSRMLDIGPMYGPVCPTCYGSVLHRLDTDCTHIPASAHHTKPQTLLLKATHKENTNYTYMPALSAQHPRTPTPQPNQHTAHKLHTHTHPQRQPSTHQPPPLLTKSTHSTHNSPPLLLVGMVWAGSPVGTPQTDPH